MVARATPADFGIGRLFEVVPDAIIVADARSGRIVCWNPAATKMFGYAAAEATGMLIEALVPADLREKHRSGLRRYGLGEPSHLVDSDEAVELPACRKDGESLWVELKLCSVPVEVDSVTHVLAVIRDVTHRKAAEEETRAQAEAMRVINEDLRDFLSIAAHDIVSPAGAIRSALRTLAAVGPDQRTALLEIVGRQAERIVRLGQELGQVGVIERGSVIVQPESVSVRDVFEAAVEAASVGDVLRGTEIDLSLRFHADRDQATRIVTNYLSNAVKYGEPPIEFRASRSGSAVTLRVVDHGAGVAPDFVPRLFEKFARGSGTADGLGLGLAIVRGLAEANQGAAWYEPVEPHGASFAVMLPSAG